jgi:hypothetical protein
LGIQDAKNQKNDSNTNLQNNQIKLFSSKLDRKTERGSNARGYDTANKKDELQGKNNLGVVG